MKPVKITYGKFESRWAGMLTVNVIVFPTLFVLSLILHTLNFTLLSNVLVVFSVTSLIAIIVSSVLDGRTRWTNYELNAKGDKVNKRYGGKWCDQGTQRFQDDGGFLDSEKLGFFELPKG